MNDLIACDSLRHEKLEQTDESAETEKKEINE